MEAIKTANVVLRFLLELCVLAALGYWGFQTGQSLLAKIGLGIGVPVLAAVAWGLLGAPGSPWQLHDPWHLVVRRIGATYIPFGERRGREHTTSGTVAYLAGKPKEDSSMPQRWDERKALMFVPMCPARYGETTLSNLVSSGESHARRCR